MFGLFRRTRTPKVGKVNGGHLYGAEQLAEGQELGVKTINFGRHADKGKKTVIYPRKQPVLVPVHAIGDD